MINDFTGIYYSAVKTEEGYNVQGTYGLKSFELEVRRDLAAARMIDGSFKGLELNRIFFVVTDGILSGKRRGFGKTL